MVSNELSDDRTLGDEVEGADRSQPLKTAGVGPATDAGVIATAGQASAQITGEEQLVPKLPQRVAPPRQVRDRGPLTETAVERGTVSNADIKQNQIEIAVPASREILVRRIPDEFQPAAEVVVRISQNLNAENHRPLIQVQPTRQMGRRPDFLIIGAVKSGTSSLAMYLAAHPEAFVAHRKEVRFFDDDSNFSRGIEWYERQFVGAEEARAVGEASPFYMASPEAASRIANTVPHARLIAVLRNPVDRAYSHYLHNRTWWRESRGFSEALADEREGRRIPQRFRYLALGRYAEQLTRFLSVLDSASIQVLFFEDLRESPASIFTSVCEFLNIDSTFIPANVGARYNPQSHVVSARLGRALSRWRTRPGLPSKLVRYADRVNVRARGAPYAPMPSGVREWLSEYFHEPNSNLADLLGLEIESWWPSMDRQFRERGRS